ncbi:MAG: PfkB family carbohydrate kinase, partial [Candidatus Marinamargulisbacteria bacterium]|nr:PfkB family carbohydrate kinase [Candidatus Marinamargulisbacteria bacterium]
RAQLVSRVGNDANGTTMRQALRQLNIHDSLVSMACPTIKKVRIMGMQQQLLRLDIEQKTPLTSSERAQIETRIQASLATAGVVVLSDYAKGLLGPDLCQFIIQSLGGCPVIVDPKVSDWTAYLGAYMITPNFKEFSAVVTSTLDDVGTLDNTDAIIETYGPKIRERYQLTYLLVTRSNRGMSLIGAAGCLHFPVVSEAVIDVSGAGDTVVATLAVGLAMGRSIQDSVHMANRAAMLVVKKVGTAVVSESERAVVLG